MEIHHDHHPSPDGFAVAFRIVDTYLDGRDRQREMIYIDRCQREYEQYEWDNDPIHANARFADDKEADQETAPPGAPPDGRSDDWETEGGAVVGVRGDTNREDDGGKPLESHYDGYYPEAFDK